MFDVGQQIEVAIIDLFICGAEPTSSALSWAILCMVAFPDIQRRCHEEIDCVRTCIVAVLTDDHFVTMSLSTISK